MARARANSGTVIPDHKVSEFFGMNTEVLDIKTLKDGWSPDSLNWITGTEKDNISLRRGTSLLGQTRNTGTGKITGLGVGTRDDGTEVPFFSYARKVKYYDSATDDTVEVGSNLLPAAADGEEVSIFPYQNLAGAFVYLSSVNSSVYKIPVANPGSAVDQSMTDYKGFLKFGQSRSILFNRKGSNGFTDTNGLYMSWVDAPNLGNTAPFAQVTAESVGSSGSTHYTFTLATVSGKKTAVQVQISATVAAGDEIFLDDKSGNLVSNYGGTGTVNYATGAVDVTFSDVTTGGVEADYYTEDATDHGVLDFDFSGTRVAGEGRYFKQFDGGGKLNSVFSLANVFYSFHEKKTWQTTIPTDDDDQGATPATNLTFREDMGVSYPYSVYGGTENIWFINNANPTEPQVYKLQPYTGATVANIAKPQLISDALNLSGFQFDYAVIYEWGIYVLLCCQQIRNGVADAYNSRTFLYNTKSKTWDLLDYPCSKLIKYAGTLVAGDPLTNNVFTLFSGFDDDGALIYNYWTSGATNHSAEGQKVHNRMKIEGLIQTSQNIEVYESYGGAWIKIFTIQGTGSYVDSSKSIAVGSFVVGSKVVGGGGTVFANPFEIEFPVNSPRYEYVRVKFQATDGGYAQINNYEFKDIRYKGHRSLPERTIN